MQTKNRGREKK